MMPTMAAPTVTSFMASALTMPLPMVVATAVPESAPTMLRPVAIMTASRGERTRVDTTVAMALGASVQPLTNSAPRTRRRTIMRPGESSGILEDYTLQNIGHILAAVGGALQG